MWNKSEGYYSKFRYVEIGRYLEIDGQKMVARWMLDKKKMIPLIIDLKDVPKYQAKNSNVGLYTSLFRYNSQSLDRAIRLGSVYFDIDSVDTDVSLTEARKLVTYLREYIPVSAIRIYFSGKKGFHIECEAVALGVTPSNNLPTLYRYIANQLKDELSLTTFDFAVYDPRRMWRLPYSKHQVTGLYKIEITADELQDLSFSEIADIAKEPRKLEVPEQVFSLEANMWYRGFTYQMEADSQKRDETKQSIIERFQNHGTGHIAESEKEFDPVKLFNNCPAILELWEKAETKKDLDHEERLFLCSLLTYTDEAIEYLHSILSNCADYNFEKSQSHIEDWMRRREMGIGGRPYTCDRARSAGIHCNGCEKLEPKQKYERIGDKLYPTNETTSPSPVRFAYGNKK